MTFNAMANSPADSFYVRGNLDSAETLQDVVTFLVSELERLQEALEQQRTLLYLSPQDQLPLTAFRGQMAYFEAGVAGASEGFYGYEAGSWNKL